MPTITLPTPDGRLERFATSPPSEWPETAQGPFSRIAFSAEFATGGRWDTLVPAEPGPRFRDRVRAAIGAIAAQHGTDRTNATTVIACHNGVINAHLADVLGLDRDYALRPAHASLTRCWYAAGRWTVYSVNETAHLAAELRTS